MSENSRLADGQSSIEDGSQQAAAVQSAVAQDPVAAQSPFALSVTALTMRRGPGRRLGSTRARTTQPLTRTTPMLTRSRARRIISTTPAQEITQGTAAVVAQAIATPEVIPRPRRQRAPRAPRTPRQTRRQTQLDRMMSTANDVNLNSSEDEEIIADTEAEPTPIILTCPICLMSLPNRKPVSTQCGHIFCRHCIKRAFRIKQECPICKQLLKVGPLHRIYLNQ